MRCLTGGRGDAQEDMNRTRDLLLRSGRMVPKKGEEDRLSYDATVITQCMDTTITYDFNNTKVLQAPFKIRCVVDRPFYMNVCKYELLNLCPCKNFSINNGSKNDNSASVFGRR